MEHVMFGCVCHC